MPASPEWRSVMKALSWAGAFCLSTISYLMFGRSKLATKLRRAGQPEPIDDLLSGEFIGRGGQRDARHVGKTLRI